MSDFRRIASGDYETSDGVRLYRLVDVHPPAWNVERGTDIIVDGAATKRDALALYEAHVARRVADQRNREAR